MSQNIGFYNVTLDCNIVTLDFTCNNVFFCVHEGVNTNALPKNLVSGQTLKQENVNFLAPRSISASFQSRFIDHKT